MILKLSSLVESILSSVMIILENKIIASEKEQNVW